ncbi:MalM family protein [Vibrio sp. SS-MA-C1-2]|uniref:MalM family protein n=1 Tax=Vibrio sp. SS-MA-C1-2 TaxID=2908646 RepID=UPI001F2F3D62|nr:MalM family protein [Vibrio sp. SS-MA-C1-2]UJF18649.1 MalM family protein [Vibrio sp. SS-MA-C1-2]
MKKVLLPLCITAALLSGCASNVQVLDTDTTSQQLLAQNTQLSNLNWQQAKFPSSMTFTLDESSQTLHSDLSQGPVASFTLPANKGSINFSLDSFANASNMKKASVFSPNIAILNEDNQVLETFNASEFKYKPAKLLDSDLLEGEFTYIPVNNMQTIKVLIYTTESDLNKTTELLHPAKAYAIAHGNVPPAIPDPIAKHTTDGKFRLKISQVGQQPVINQTPIKADQAPTLDETKAYYTNAIEKAVKDDQLDKAITLMNEAEQLGIKDAKQTFIDAVNENK